jgi:hypothetical protein
VKSRRGRRRFALQVGTVALLAEVFVLWQRGYGLGGNVVVRCQQRHLFTTIWIPGASLKSLRFLWWRFQRCPVGSHWSFVTPVKESELTEEEKRLARGTEDIRVP